ncbi:TPA: DUF922 domain-containing protein [candidate division WWE3 bacterium]|uniref:DUF922 domain-containing protein n=1 Tax=candidate division WWE3 bacterium TaxID=2053526 RepID=A0A656PPZ3_UNCKA|nr:hypothetical protein P147_WWE3C00001G0908 [candidate division WWE3 bacterium RAAC2_WWE3_1]KKS29481.1 MAG: hypothetical protein UU91_C0005G0013 [candidate division WWE3 bacterium GW2011_GWB1_42_117]KKS54912.1 MAG: hypothetical protein UV21_C0004G0077 [candidate division WWE3 bacterium GW2011_GWD2_42_34]KKT05528.1 MAG: hypothetical protein UV83_C0003G0083 [candidate division WWE3 bacterium GW2011_GWE2_43_18]KKT06718.1 MAG: hypothetical protein UV84_C0004G0006 [candidate division WWE3 bacterium
MILTILTPLFFTLWLVSICIFIILVELSNLPIAPENIGNYIGLTIVSGIFFFISGAILSLIRKDKILISDDTYTKFALSFGALFVILLSVSYYFYRSWGLKNYESKRNVVSLKDSPEYKAVEEKPEVQKHGYQPGPTINSVSQSYFVEGSTREELCNSVEKWQENQGLERTLAHINYNLENFYYTIYTDRGWTIGNFTVTANAVITVPQWRSSAGASDGTKSDWRAFKNAVASHEREHQDILVEHANKLVDRYNNLGYYQTEAALKTAIDNTYGAVMTEMDKAQEVFDDKHGESDSYSYLCR